MAIETPWADEKSPPIVGSAASSSYDDSGPCIFSDHPAPSVSIINTEQKNHDYMEKIMEVNDKLDTVKNIARPGCSNEVLNTALRCMSLLATTLSTTSQKVRASL